MSEKPYYRVEHPTMSGLQSYLNRAHESGWEVVSLSADGYSSIATLILKDGNAPPEVQRRAHLREWVRGLPPDVDGEAGMVKLVRHLLADMDELVAALQPHQRDDQRRK